MFVVASTMAYYTLAYYTVAYYTMTYYTMAYYTMAYYTMAYYTLAYYTMPICSRNILVVLTVGTCIRKPVPMLFPPLFLV